MLAALAAAGTRGGELTAGPRPRGARATTARGSSLARIPPEEEEEYDPARSAPSDPIERLCRDGRRAMWSGIRAVRPGAPLNAIGKGVEGFARKNGYTLIRNLASHGVGRSLHEEPEGLATWYDPADRRTIGEGLVFTIEPFLALGDDWVDELDDGWTLRPSRGGPAVQYEHTLVATKNGPVILTLAA